MHCCSCFKCTALFCFSLVHNYFLWLQNSTKLSIIFLLPLSWNKFCFTTELDWMWVYLMSQPYFHCFESLLQSCSQPFDTAVDKQWSFLCLLVHRIQCENKKKLKAILGCYFWLLRFCFQLLLDRLSSMRGTAFSVLLPELTCLHKRETPICLSF